MSRGEAVVVDSKDGKVWKARVPAISTSSSEVSAT